MLSNGVSWACGGCVSVPGLNAVTYDCYVALRGNWPGPYAIHATQGAVHCRLDVTISCTHGLCSLSQGERAGVRGFPLSMRRTTYTMLHDLTAIIAVSA